MQPPCTMLVANSSLDSSVGAPFAAASLHLCTMADTNSFFLGVIGAPTVAASLYHCAMSHANPSASGLVGASFEGAMSVFFRCPGAIIFVTLIFQDRLWLVGLMRQRRPVGILFLARNSRLVGATDTDGTGGVDLSAHTK